jgi:hypothetical protein
VDVVSTVRDYCKVDQNAYKYFDSIHLSTDQNDIEPADILIANNLNGRVQLAEFAAIWERLEKSHESVRSDLRSIPKDAALDGAEADVLRAAGRLLDQLCGPLAYESRMTKILHKKRPDLVPIIDSRVLPQFVAVIPTVTGRSWEEYFILLGQVIGDCIASHADLLDEAREDFPELTRLRTFDICLWKTGAVASG